MGAYNRDYLFRGFSMRYKLVRGILLLEVYRFRGRGEGGGFHLAHKNFFHEYWEYNEINATLKNKLNQALK